MKQPYGVLILHGFTSSLDCVRGIQPPLTTLGLPTRMPVLRGHGQVPEALRGVVWRDWVADSEVALQDLLKEADKAILVGHSMGALLAVHLAAEYAETVDSLVLAAPAVQLASPLAPGRPLQFLQPLLARVLRKWDLPPIYADPALAQYDTNYPWAPTGAIVSLLEFSLIARRRLPEVAVPTLVMQSRRDTTVAPESAEIVYREIATPSEHKRIVWFEKTEHEMFRDCECDAAIDMVVGYVQERVGLATGSTCRDDQREPVAAY